MSNSCEREDRHLADVDPGAGCVEIWEQLSEHREALDADKTPEQPAAE